MPRILVLDDEPLISMMLQGWLTELACETVGPVCTVQGALRLIESAPPDAAILDLSLAGTKSYEVASALRCRRIPFAFATGYGEKGVEAPFEEELVALKPFDFETIKQVVEGLLSGDEHPSH
jgi:CheY-like chemotaxis protein